jgi:hypothetical protein
MSKRAGETRLGFTGLRPFASWTVLLIAVASSPGASGQAQQDCTQLLQAQDGHAVVACKAQLDEAEKAPATERMARIVANDEYGVALMAVAHKPQLALAAFNRAIELLPSSTVKPDSLQWAVTFWHRATAYQQLLQWNHAAGDLATAEGTFTRAITAASGNATLTEHFTELRKRVRTQHADMLVRMGKRTEAQKLLATQ